MGDVGDEEEVSACLALLTYGLFRILIIHLSFSRLGGRH